MSAEIVPGSLAAWIIALRPKTLFIAVVPVMVGTALVFFEGKVQLGPAVAALIGAILLQIGTNLANDVYDHERGADGASRLGPIRATSTGLLRPRQVRVAMLLSFVLATAVGLYLTWVAGWVIVAIGLASILAAWAYTGGPWPLGYHGLGDVTVMLFFGFAAVLGTCFVQGAPISALAVSSAGAIGALATAVLVVNNVRDYEGDGKAGKRTVVVRFGRSFGVLEYGLLLLIAELVPVVAFLSGWAGPSVLLPLLTTAHAVRLVQALRVERGRDLNPRLLGTVKLLVAYGFLLAVGLTMRGT